MKLKYSLVFLLVTLLSSCSLMKVDISTGDTPLSGEDLKMRMLTRGFYNSFNSSVIQAADSIINTTDEVKLKLRATKWKLNATSAATMAVYQTTPETSLLNLWSMSKRMATQFNKLPDSLLFGELTPIATNCSNQLLQGVDSLASDVLSKKMYTAMGIFIDNNVITANGANTELANEGLSLQWDKYLRSEGLEASAAIGSISEVMSDLTDRVSGYSVQYTNQIDWTGDMFAMKLKQDSIHKSVLAQLDTMSMNFTRITKVLESSPELMNEITTDLNKQLEEMVGTINSSVNTLFINIDYQRDEVQNFVANQREVLVTEIDTVINKSIDKVVEELPLLIGEILIYIVTFVVILFAIPFVLGFIIGKSVGSKRERKRLSGDK